MPLAAGGMTAALDPANATSAVMPSMSSVRDGGSRPVAASSDDQRRNREDAERIGRKTSVCQVDRIGAVELWKYRNPAVPPIPEIVVARMLL